MLQSSWFFAGENPRQPPKHERYSNRKPTQPVETRWAKCFLIWTISIPQHTTPTHCISFRNRYMGESSILYVQKVTWDQFLYFSYSYLMTVQMHGYLLSIERQSRILCGGRFTKIWSLCHLGDLKASALTADIFIVVSDLWVSNQDLVPFVTFEISKHPFSLVISSSW